MATSPPNNPNNGPRLAVFETSEPTSSREELHQVRRGVSAEELCRRTGVRLSVEDRELLHPLLTPREYFTLLLKDERLAAARRVLAQALPMRRLIWWATLCAADSLARCKSVDAARRADAEQLLDDVVRFVHAPSDSLRREIGRRAKSVGTTTCDGLLAAAVFHSSGSLAPHGAPEVRPKPSSAARLAGTAVYLASVRVDTRDYQTVLRDYLHLGWAVARGDQLWTSDAQGARHVVDAGAKDHAIRGPHRRPILSQDYSQETDEDRHG